MRFIQLNCITNISQSSIIVDYATSFLRQFFTTSGEKLAQVHEFAYVLFAIFFLSSNSQNNRLFHVDVMKF